MIFFHPKVTWNTRGERHRCVDFHPYIRGPSVAALMTTTMRMKKVSTIDRKDTWWWHTHTYFQPPGRWQTRPCDSRPHLPEPLDVSIKRQRQREHDRRQQDHKLALRKDVTWAHCSAGRNVESGNVYVFVCFLSSHVFIVDSFESESEILKLCEPPGILWNTLVRVSPVVML